MVIVTWLLISSLSTIVNIQPSGSSTNKGTSGHNGGSKTSGGNGGSLGNGNGGGLLGSQLFNFNLPNINFNYYLQFPKLVIPFPNFVFPKLYIPPINLFNNFNFKQYGGGGGQSSSAHNTLTKLVPIILNKNFLIFLFVILGIFMVFVALRNQPKTKREKSKQPKTLKNNLDEPLYKTINEEYAFEDIHKGNRQLFNYKIEKIPYKGWGGEGIIRPHIASDLPLTWQCNNSLEIDRDSNTILKLNDNLIESNIIDIEFGSNKISARNDVTSKELQVLGVNYEEHIRDTVIINIPEEFAKVTGSYTLKEIYNMNEIGEIFSSERRLDKALLTFERAYYGKKTIKRDEYETFLRCIRDDLGKPYIAWMVMNNGRN